MNALIVTPRGSRMVRLNLSAQLRRYTVNRTMAAGTVLRKLIPDLALMMTSPGETWVGNYNDEQAETRAAWERGELGWDTRSLAENTINL